MLSKPTTTASTWCPLLYCPAGASSAAGCPPPLSAPLLLPSCPGTATSTRRLLALGVDEGDGARAPVVPGLEGVQIVVVVLIASHTLTQGDNSGHARAEGWDEANGSWLEWSQLPSWHVEFGITTAGNLLEEVAGTTSSRLTLAGRGPGESSYSRIPSHELLGPDTGIVYAVYGKIGGQSTAIHYLPPPSTHSFQKSTYPDTQAGRQGPSQTGSRSSKSWR